MVIQFESAEKQLIQEIKSHLGLENEGFKTLISEGLSEAMLLSSKCRRLLATRYDVHPCHGIICDSLDDNSARRYYKINRSEEAEYFSNVISVMQGNWIVEGFDAYANGTVLQFGDKESCASRVLVGLTLSYLINSKFKREQDITSFDVNDSNLLFKGGDNLVILLTDYDFANDQFAFCREQLIILNLKKGTYCSGGRRSFRIQLEREREFTHDIEQIEISK